MNAATATIIAPARFFIGEFVLYHGSVAQFLNHTGVVTGITFVLGQADRYSIDMGAATLHNVREASISPDYYPDVHPA